MSASPAPAAPLCKDLKGLFTPCPKELNKAASKQLEARAAREHGGKVRRTSAGDPTEANTSVVTAQTPEPKAERLPFVAGITASVSNRLHPAKLCHDLKGLFTPCPKADRK